MMKKLISALLALTMALALAVPASAAGEEPLGVIGGADGPTSIMTIGVLDDAATDTAVDEEALAALRAQTIELLGGKAGETNVLFNGRCIRFTDASPEAKDGRTMVPLRATLESMGATVGYDQATKTAIVTGEKVSFTHVIGSDTIVLSDGTEVKMDVASYATAANRTMVPVRFFSQVLGYDVFWDNDYKLVFLLDEESMVAAVDEHFAILNDYLAKAAKNFDPAKNYRQELTLSGAVKVIDSINGSRSEPYSVRAEALVGRDGMSMEMNAELGGILTLLEAFAGESFPAEYRTLLEKTELAMRCGERVYFSSPLFTAMLGGAVQGNVWFTTDEVDYTALYGALYGDAGRYTIGSICYALMLQGDENHFYRSWSEMGDLASVMIALLGDETFTKSGSSCKWHLGLDELAAYMNSTAGAEDGLYTAADFREAGLDVLDVSMTLRADGSASLKFALEMSQGQQSVLRVDLTAAGSQAKSTLKGTVQVYDTCDVTFDGTVTTRTTSEKIVTELPEGTVIIDLAA